MQKWRNLGDEAMRAWEQTPEGLAWQADKDAEKARTQAREKAEREENERAADAHDLRLRGRTEPHYQSHKNWRENGDWYVCQD